MRQIINISLPQSMSDLVNKEVKEKSYASKSEFFRYLIRDWLENETISQVLKSKKQMKKGDKYPLKSFKDLRNM